MSALPINSPQNRWQRTAGLVVDRSSGSRFFGIAAQIGNPISQLRAAVLIAFGFSEGEREFQLLELMTTFKET